MELLTPETIAERKPSGWELDRDRGSLVKEFDCGNFLGAVEFINRIAMEAEKQDHHPDILLHRYSKVLVTLSTHSEGGVTEGDIALASIIDAVH